MKKISLIVMAILLISTFSPLAFAAGGPVQPPVDTTTLYSTTIAWGPAHADPGRAYDTASGELIFNVYDTLIGMGEDITNYLGTWDTFESYWAFEPSLSMNVPARQEVFMTFLDTGLNPLDPKSYWFQPIPPDGKFYHIEQWINNNVTDDVVGPCDVLFIGEYLAPMEPIQAAITIRTWHVLEFVPGNFLLVHHYYYDFNIRTSPAVNFVDNTGAVIDTFDINDVEYSLEKVCVRSLSPSWMFFKPLFDVWYVNSFNTSMGYATASWLWSLLIKDAFEILPGNVFRINVGIPFADNAFKQILTQTWSSIMSKSWNIGKGVWDGNLFTDVAPADGVPDWYVTIARKNGPADPVNPGNYAGTGPYRVTTADPTIEQGLVVLERNALYWGGWPAPGKKAYLERVQIDYVPDWTIRKTLFTDCKSDVTAVPRSNMFELLDAFGDPINPEIKTIKSIVPVLSMDAVFYTWDVDPTAFNALYTEVLPTGAPRDFMNDVHVRNAFTYAFNRTKYIEQAWYKEGICRETPGILGLIPEYYTKGDGSPANPWKFSYNLAAMEAELKLAMFTQGATTQSVWAWGGFHIDIFYNSGNDPRRIACELIQEGFTALNTASGKNFQVTVQAPDWATYLGYMEASCMPVWIIGWLADYADAGNWYGPYMHSEGDFAVYQRYPPTTPGPRTGFNKDQLVDFAFKTPDGASRANMYADLDDIYLIDNPGFPIIQPQGRRWAKYWVKGWHYNALYPSSYYYYMYKEDTCWANINGPVAGVPDAKTDMRDISYAAGHFGAKAPNPGALPPTPIYDPKWAPGGYGTGGCDIVGDRKVDMRDIAFAAAHFLHEARP